MKKLFAMAMASLMCLSVSAQKAPGTFTIYPRVGINLSKITKDYFVSQAGEGKSKYKEGITAGVEARYQILDYLGVSAGALFSNAGTRFKDEAINLSKTERYSITRAKNRLYYLQVPVLANIDISNTGLTFKAGVQFGFLFSAKSKYTEEIGTKNNDEWIYDRKEYNPSIDDSFKKVDVGIPVGLAYEYRNVSLDFRYIIGLTRIYNVNYGETKCRNSSFMITAGYSFDL